MEESKNKHLKEVISGIKFRYKIKTQKEIVERMGYSSATNLSDMLNGSTPISESFSDKLKEVFMVNPDFLKTGEGNIWIDESTSMSNNQSSAHITGNDNHINNSTTIEKALDEISEMRKLLAEAIRNNKEQTDRFFTIIETMRK